jgi:type VI secretion system protein ImpK
LKPRFASAVDPVFVSALHALERLDQGQQLEPLELSSELEQRLADGDARLGLEPNWCLAKYALVAWIDEMLVNHAWQGSKWWSNNVLEARLFQSRLCSVRFFELAKQASAFSDSDALEVFQQCVILGFRGMYAPTGEISEITSDGDYPTTLDNWLRTVDRRLASAQLTQSEEASSPVAGQPTWAAISGAPPYPGRLRILIWSVAALLLLVINLIVYQA